MSSSTTAAPKKPFDVIIITSPDEQAARAVREVIVSSCGDFPSPSSSLSSSDRNQSAGASASASSTSVLQSADGTLFISSCDPYGARMGSGGGTIAALAEADEAYRQRQLKLGRDAADDDGATTLPTVLICHAGGESSRCPTQIVLGKAWTSLPVRQKSTLPDASGSAESSAQFSATTVVSNPTSLLISSLSNVFSDVPTGSVVVAASDVLLSFFDGVESSSNNNTHQQRKINFDNILMHDTNGNGGVIGLAVPAPLTTAKNHGVFVLNPSSQHQQQGKDWQIQTTHSVLQKPPVSQMTSMTDPPCTFHHEDEPKQTSEEDGHSKERERNAWIDTGVITFLPAAAGTLRELSRSELKCCTRSGLGELYEEQCIAKEKGGATKRQKLDPPSKASDQSASSAAMPSLEEFARSTAPKICLYGDMLHALRTSSTASAKQNDSSDAGGVLGMMSKKLSEHELYTCTIPTGSFVHLGTTGELMDFLTFGASDAMDNGGVDAAVQENGTNGESESHQERNKQFGRTMGLMRRSDSFVSGFEPEKTKDSIVLNSVLVSESTTDSVIGKGSVLEHCHIECAQGIQIGERCLLSGIRGSFRDSSFCVPSGLCLQLLPMRQTTKSEGLNGSGEAKHSFVCLCLGVEDGIKDAPPNTLFGMDLNDVLKKSGLVEDDLWDESIPSSKRMLWNAKIVPVLSSNGDGMDMDFSFLDWITCLKDSDGPLTPAANLGLKQWRGSARISLSAIRSCVDSAAEAKYRSSVSPKKARKNRLAEVSNILISRRHEPCNFDFLLDFVTASYSAESAQVCWRAIEEALTALDTAALHALSKALLDVVGRTFMIISLLLADIRDSLQKSSKIHSTIDMDVSKDEMNEYSLEKTIAQLQSVSTCEAAMSSVVSVRNKLLVSGDGLFKPKLVPVCCEFLERAAAAMTEHCISGVTIDKNPTVLASAEPIPTGHTATASAPARIDISGGWSDTPPISYEMGGAVACLAVLVDGKRPLRAQCRVVEGKRGIVLRIESRDLQEESLINSSEVAINSLGDLADFRNPTAKCALLKCALIQLGLVPLDSILEGANGSIQPHLKKFCKSDLDDVCLEITSTSLLPTGSGMGSSSILGGCIIAAIAKCCGIFLTGMGDTPTNQIEVNDSTSLIHAVLMLEQLLTTGGGWQDNIGGLVGGLKLGSSDAHVLPLQTKVQRFSLPAASIKELNQRLVLAFSGQPRLAKNILQKVLRRWASRSSEITDTVDSLVHGASDAISKFQEDNFDGLGEVMSQYWQQKMAMAGAESGVEPESVRSLLELLSSKRAIVGGTLCGAGGGGFLALLASEGNSLKDIEAIAKQAVLAGNNPGLDSFSWHSCTVSESGLVMDIAEA